MFAVARAKSLEGRPSMDSCALRWHDPENGETLTRLGKELRLKSARCATILKPGEYQMLLVEAPKVPESELRQAVRWQIKDLLDHPVDEVMLDVLEIPVITDDPLANRYMYVIAAPNSIVVERMKRFDEAKLRLAVIDIPETAQRNISALFEEDGRSCATLYVGDDSSLLTVTNGGELYLARRIEITAGQMTAGLPEARREFAERMLHELQRTLDHFERQYRSLPIGKLALGPLPEDDDLDSFISDGLGLSVELIDFAEVLDLPEVYDRAKQWRLFHSIGAALRNAPVV